MFCLRKEFKDIDFFVSKDGTTYEGTGLRSAASGGQQTLGEETNRSRNMCKLWTSVCVEECMYAGEHGCMSPPTVRYSSVYINYEMGGTTVCKK